MVAIMDFLHVQVKVAHDLPVEGLKCHRVRIIAKFKSLVGTNNLFQVFVILVLFKGF